MSFRFQLILVTLLIFLVHPLYGQIYLMDGSPVTDCSGTFYDSGGPNGNYGNNQNLTTTICSDGSTGSHVRLDFTGTGISSGDLLCFYDGPNLSAPLLACQTDFAPNAPFMIQATSSNTSGCITVSFTSNLVTNGTGWAASISCVPACQTILADVLSTDPATVPADTGWIDICPGDRVEFNGAGIYPQNNLEYAQSDQTTGFEWNFGDGDIATGTTVSHQFLNPGGYYVQLTLTDQYGCKNTNLIKQRVRVAGRPTFDISGALVPIICAGDTLTLGASTDASSGSDLTVSPNLGEFSQEGIRSDSLALPDGTGIPYQTSILFTGFGPGQLLTNASDLESICVNIEHSWARDMEITLTCPNGQTIILHDHPGNFGDEIFLGIPNDNDNIFPVPGTGFTYCWTNNATNPTWLDYADNVLGGSGTLPPGDYTPYDPISDLIGCPLNGNWTLGVTDWWPLDNGFIFNWSLTFASSLFPTLETFSPSLVSWEWSPHPSIFSATPDSIHAAPQIPGNAQYVFTVQDSYGCSWDTTVVFQVLPPTHPACFNCGPDIPLLPDTTICSGGSVRLDASVFAPSIPDIRFESTPDAPVGFANHPPTNPYFDDIPVSSLGYNNLTNPTQQIRSVCVDIETDNCADLSIFLRAPSGQLLDLSSNNGGNGKNYKVTCFSPSALTSIVGQSAPFNGTYRPEGNWNSLLGASVNGDWSLRVSDAANPNNVGKVKWWSIEFDVANSITYNWSNGSTLSCINCPNPVATPVQTTSYAVSTTDNFGCVHHDTVSVNVTTFFPAPTGLSVISIGPGFMVWGWDPVPGALGYEVSINGGSWQAANGTLKHSISGLQNGQNVSIQVRAISPNCPAQVAQATTNLANCNMNANITGSMPARCSNDSTGSVVIATAGGNTPFHFYLDNWPNAFTSGNLQNILPAGNHQILVLDALGCTDTLQFNIPGPPPIQLNTNVVDVKCHGENTGSFSVSATGGTGALSYNWQGCQGGPLQSGSGAGSLAAGCYHILVTDAQGCLQTGDVTVTEPADFNLTSGFTPVSCFGGNNGIASVTVSGATPPYSYLWDNGQNNATSMGFTAGTHSVTVTDANQCQSTATVDITQPQALVISGTNAQPVSCFGGTNGAATVTVSGGTLPYSYHWDTGQNSQTAQNISGGPHGVTVTDANGCNTQIVVTVPEPFELQTTFANVIDEPCVGVCQGQAMAQPTGGTPPYLYFWSNPAITPGVQTATGLCPGAYTVTVHDVHGCTTEASVTIQPAVPLQVQFTPTIPTCVGLSNGSIQAAPAGGTGPYQYFWENGNTTNTLQNIACGAHFLTITDGLGCASPFTYNLSCATPVTPTISGVNAASCFGLSNGSIVMNPQGGVGPYQYAWSDPAAQTNQQAVNLAAGTYTVTVTDANQCSVTTSATVTQPALLTTSLTPVHLICQFTPTGSITATPAGGTAPYTYAWSSGNGNSAQIGNLLAGVYTVTVTDAHQCTSTASVQVTQPAQGIQLDAMQVQAACYGESNGQASASASGTVGPYVYSWSTNQQSALVTGLAPGTYTVSATDQMGCVVSETVTIQQLEKVMVNVAFVPPTCFGYSDAKAAVNLLSGGAGMGDTSLYHYQWNIPNTPDVAILTGLLGDRTYTITVTDLQGCSGTYSFFLEQPPAIVIDENIMPVRCFGGSDGSVAVTGAQFSNPPIQYAWSLQQNGSSVSNLAAGSYTVTVTDVKGCKAVETFQVTQPPVLQLSFEQIALKCALDSNAVVNTSVKGGTGGYSYQWSNGHTEADISGLGPATYFLTVTDANGCTIQGQQVIVQPDSLLLALEMIQPRCFGHSNGRIVAHALGGNDPYQYSLNGSEFGGGGTFIALKSGIYTVRVRDANGCITTFADTLDQPPAILVDLPRDTTLVYGQGMLLDAGVSNTFGAATYQWESSFTDTLTCVDTVDCEQIWIQPEYNNFYRLTVSDEKGCTGTASVRVNVYKPRGIYVPTAFSPNGDLTNDLLVVHGLSSQVNKVLVFRVFDRWGEMVYEDRDFGVNDTGRGWDGLFRGQPSDPGVFVWYLEAEYRDGYREILKGDVTLIR